MSSSSDWLMALIRLKLLEAFGPPAFGSTAFCLWKRYHRALAFLHGGVAGGVFRPIVRVINPTVPRVVCGLVAGGSAPR